jgi:hypothetical protein
MFDSGEYYLKATLYVDDIESLLELYVKDEMMVTYVEMEGASVRMIMRDGKTFVVNDDAKVVIAIDTNASGIEQSSSPVDTEDMQYVGSGSSEFHGRVLLFDQYVDNDGLITQFYMDGTNLAGIRSIIDGYTVDIVIIELSENVPDSVFEFPDDYVLTEL